MTPPPEILALARAAAAADPRYARLFGLPGAPDAPAAGRGPCAHLGEDTGERLGCPSCPRRGSQAKVFACALHGRCTVAQEVPGVRCCASCGDFAPREDGPAMTALPASHRFRTRDVLYHLYPMGGEAGRVWRKCLGKLLRNARLFNGLKVISCMTGPGLEPPSVVRALAEPHGFEVAEIANDPKLRETKTFVELLPRFETSDPERAFYHGHAKGVTRPINLGVTCHPWSDLCHEVTLDYWPLVEAQLRRHLVTGPFKKVGKGFQGSKSAWHYSGTFFWARSAELFARDWRRIDRRWWGSESYVGLHYRPDEAGCLFHEGAVPTLDLYRMAYLHDVLVQYSWWRAEHDHLRTERGAVAS